MTSAGPRLLHAWSISAAWGRTFHLRRIAQGAPSARRRDEMHLAIKCPVPPLFTNAITEHHLRNIAVTTLMATVSPAFQHLHIQHLDIEQLGVVAHPRHVANERFAAAPCPLRVFG